MFLGSDAIALAPFTDTISYLEDGDFAVLTRKGAEIRDAKGSKVERAVLRTSASAFLVDKGNYRHFMAKEIHEQPEVVGHTLAHYLDMAAERVLLPNELPFDFRGLQRISISACGTSYYAGLVARYWFERLARLPVEIDVASEFRYREAPQTPADSQFSCPNRARPPIPSPPFAMPGSTGSTRWPSSTCPPRRLRAKATP